MPDLVEYPAVVAGTFAPEFLTLPEEVLTTTMIHHQHFFPVSSPAGKLLPAFLAVTNTQADNARALSRNFERVLTARLRDARFFFDADRAAHARVAPARAADAPVPQEAGQLPRQGRCGSSGSRAGLPAEVLGVPAQAEAAATAGRLAKADLTTDMVRELTELQGTMGGIYAREEGLPETVWRAIYHQYLPAAVEADAPPSRADLGAAAVTWAALSLADKLDTHRRRSSRRASGRPARATRSACAGRRTACSRCSWTCPS